MIKKNRTSRDNEQKQRKSKARIIGLLALATTERSSSISPCISSEEMARLINGPSLSPKEQHRYFNHLAHCETCYREWITLTQDNLSHRQAQITPAFWYRKHLGVLSTACAVAACLFLFLHIPSSDYTPQQQAPAPSSATAPSPQRESSQESALPLPPQQIKSLGSPAPSLLTESNQEHEQPTHHLLTDNLAENIEKKRELSGQADEKNNAAALKTSTSQLLAKLQRLCSSGEKIDFDMILLQIRNIRDQTPFPTEEEKTLLAEYETLLRENPANRELLCTRVQKEQPAPERKPSSPGSSPRPGSAPE